jgi:hypothetical protein
MKQVKCKSGITGWQARLRKVYANFEEFVSYCEIRNLHIRLGYKSPSSAWKWNPIVMGSVNPSDYQKVKKRN